MPPHFQRPFKKYFRVTFSILLYCIYLLVILEIVARVAVSNETFFNKIRLGEYASDSKWRLEWIKRHQKSRKGNMTYGYDAHHPVLGWVLKPNFSSKSTTINSKGIRDTREISYARTPGKQRILILGESFTFGSEVKNDENYPYFLQQLLPKADVINFAVHGYGYDQMMIYYQDEGVKYHSDIVIIPYLELDKKRSLLGFRDYAKPYFKLTNDNELVLQNTPILPPEKFFKREIFRSKLVDLIKILKRNLDVRSGRYQEKEERINEVILNELVQSIKDQGAIPVIAYLEGVRDNFKKSEPDAEDRAFFKYWSERKVPVIYVLPYVLQLNHMQLERAGLLGKPVFVQRKYGHYSPTENAMVAIAIKESLSRFNLVK